MSACEAQVQQRLVFPCLEGVREAAGDEAARPQRNDRAANNERGHFRALGSTEGMRKGKKSLVVGC